MANMNDREELIAKLNTFQTVKIQTVTADRRFTLDEVLSVNEYNRLADFITEQTRLARIDERNEIALDNYRGQTFSDGTNWEGKFQKFIENNERRLAQLAPEPEKGTEHE